MSLAFVFPGQGSQSIGMLKDLAEAESVVIDTFKLASDALGYDLWEITQQGPQEKLNSTDITQPALLAAGVACWKVWQQKGGAIPALLAGHSLGEYTALVCAGVLDFADAIKLVEVRGQFMQQAVPEGQGGMAAILGLDDAKVVEACQQAAQSDVLQAVNYNSPGQVVVAGSKAAIERIVIVAKEMGAKRALPLPVSVPSHCDLMKPAADQLAEKLKSVTFNQASIPVINNVDVLAETDADKMRDALVRQLYKPVRWVEVIQKMAGEGVDQLIECGPGRVLVGLNKRIDKSMSAAAVFDSASFDKALSAE